MVNAALTTALLLIAGSSGMMSVIGLRTAFAGMPLIITATGIGIEAGKLLLIVYLHRNWKKLNLLSKLYNMALVAILVACTSFEIFGFLAQSFTENSKGVDAATIQAAAYKKEAGILRADIKHIEHKLSYLAESKRKYRAYEYTGYNAKRDRLVELNALIASEELKAEATKSSVGPIFAISDITGIDVKSIVKWLIIVLVGVLEPMSIALTIASSKTWRQYGNRRRYLKRIASQPDHVSSVKTTKRPTMKRAA